MFLNDMSRARMNVLSVGLLELVYAVQKSIDLEDLTSMCVCG